MFGCGMCGACDDHDDYALAGGFLNPGQTCAFDPNNIAAGSGAVTCSSNNDWGDEIPDNNGNGFSDGTDAKCIHGLGVYCRKSCGCCTYSYRGGSPPPPPDIPVASSPLLPPPPPPGHPPSPPPTVYLALEPANDPKAQHTVIFNTEYTFHVFSDNVVNVGDRVCWERANRMTETTLNINCVGLIATAEECQFVADNEGGSPGYQLISPSETEPTGCFKSTDASAYGGKIVFNPSTTSVVSCIGGSSQNCRCRQSECGVRASCSEMQADHSIIFIAANSGTDGTLKSEINMCVAPSGEPKVVSPGVRK